jgi:hypothetical protein
MEEKDAHSPPSKDGGNGNKQQGGPLSIKAVFAIKFFKIRQL